MNGAKKIRELFAAGKFIVAPGAHDMLTGKIISTLGFDAVYMTGYGQSASHLGKPDVGLMSMSEMVMRAANMVEAIERGIAYQEAGADIVFIESPETQEEMKLINEKVNCLTLANMVEGGRTPMLKNGELEALGYNLVIYPTASTYVTTKAMMDLWEGLKRDGTTATMIDQMIPFPTFNEIIGLPRIREIEANYSTGRVVKGH